MKQNYMKHLMGALVLTALSSAASAQTIITQQPAGDLQTYSRSGYSYYVYDDYLRGGAQTGTIDIVFAENNKVYIKDPLAKFEMGSWVEGSLNDAGTLITVPLGQYLYYDLERRVYATLGMVEYDNDEEWCFPTDDTEVTYTITEDSIILNGTSRKGKCLGANWVNYEEWEGWGNWAGFADYDSKYTPYIEELPVEVPTDLEITIYKFNGMEYSGGEITYNVNVGFDGSDMYVQGIFYDMPESWIKGTVNGNTVTFPQGQYLGKLQSGSSNTSLYMIAVNRNNTSEIQDLVLTYDEDLDAYVNDTQFIVLNTTRGTVYLMTAFSDFSLTFSSTGEAFSVPYTESFSSSAPVNDFTIIDSNNDGATWIYNPLSNLMELNSLTGKAGDDWLITPPIMLEADQKYIFTVNARCFASSYPEQFEVMFGAEPTADAMTQPVIEPTVVTTGDMTPYTGTISVPTAGKYYFGIHGISEPDMFTLSIDDISITYDETETGLAKVNEEIFNDMNVYSIDGRIVRRNGNLSGLNKGMYIFNGKKIIIK